VNVTDDHQRLRQRLHEELGALEVSPPPVLRVTGRGQGIRTRRRALALGSLVILLAGGALSVHATAGHKPAAPRVTVSAPDPAAPGGVFASGTADGKPWKLAVRNIAADPGTRWCLPAVMFNGHYGDVLYPLAKGTQAYGNPAYLADIPGFPGIGAIFTQVKPGMTKATVLWRDGRSLAVRPVRVTGCGGEHFHLAGFVFANAKGIPPALNVEGHAGISRYDFSEGLNLGYPGLFGHTAPGVWANTDKNRADIASSRAAQPIGTGTITGMTWHIRTALGLFGQCYVATLRGGPGGGRGQSAEQCAPVAAPPRTAALDPVSIPGAATDLTGYAGLVNPRTAKVEIALSDGIIPPARPVTIAGRAYVAFAIPPGCQVRQLKLFDSAGHVFAITTSVPLPK
jgi:hypothetical protein